MALSESRYMNITSTQELRTANAPLPQTKPGLMPTELNRVDAITSVQVPHLLRDEAGTPILDDQGKKQVIYETVIKEKPVVVEVYDYIGEQPTGIRRRLAGALKKIAAMD